MRRNSTSLSAPEKLRTIDARSLEDMALLRVHGYVFIDGRIESGRITLRFTDENGDGSELLEAHNTRGVPVNSLAFSDSLRWSRDRVFSLRRMFGAEGGR